MEKSETVYVFCGTDGGVSNVIVSDWIKNGLRQTSIADQTTLSDVTVVKGNATVSAGANGATTWNADGVDVYYQGTSSAPLPVTMRVSYQLDGKPVSAEELAGKSGRVTIRYDYENTQYETVELDGEQVRLYVPFVMLTGLLLDNNSFSNIEVSNGKVVSLGDSSAVIGFALPGMQETLDIAKEDLELPSFVEVSADVTDFSLTNTLTLASNALWNEVDLSGVEDENDLSDSLDQLTDAMKQLIDGSSELYDGLSLLLEKSNTLVDGINQIASGAKTLDSGSSELYSGAVSLKDGLTSLESGLSTLCENNDTLTAGAKQVFDTLLATANQQLKAAGLNLPELTVENYDEVLSGVISNTDAATVAGIAHNTALAKVTEQVNAQKELITAKVTAAVQEKVYAGVLAQAGFTVEQYQQLLAAGMVDAATQAQVTGAVEAMMASEETQATIASTVQAQIDSLIEETMKSDTVQAQIDAAVASAASGNSSLKSLKTQLDSYGQFYNGLMTYTAGVEQAHRGSEKLVKGSASLTTGISQVSGGLTTLDEALETLSTQSAALPEGVSQLKNGAMQLSNGLKELDEKGIRKLTEVFDGDLTKLVDRLKALRDVSKDYATYSGLADGMNGTVKFLFRTESIG